MIETKRLILRNWSKQDARSLYQYASTEEISENCGFPCHKSIDDSKWVIENILNNPECYAIILKENKEIIGCVELKFDTPLTTNSQEDELGYWLGKPFRNKGYMNEACHEILDHAFNDLKLTKIWISHNLENKNSQKVIENLNFELVEIKDNKKIYELKKAR